MGKKGIVRDPLVHNAVLNDISRFAAQEGYDCKNASFSPITGGDGNIEFLLHLQWTGQGKPGAPIPEGMVNQIVEEAHKTLKAKKSDEKE